MAVDGDYQILANSLKQFADQLGALSGEVENRGATEMAEGDEANSKYWVNFLSVQLGMVRPALDELEETTSRVLGSLGVCACSDSPDG